MLNSNTQKPVRHIDFVPVPKPHTGGRDLALWNLFRQGDENALIAIFSSHTEILFNYGKKIIDDRDLVKDAIQDLFLELWKNRARLGETEHIKFYLLKSLRRKLIRIKNRPINLIVRRLTGEHDFQAVPSHEFVLIAEQMVIDNNEKLLKSLNSLSQRQREAVYLRYYDDLSYEQVAAIMNLSRQRVYNLVHEAIANLRTLINGNAF